MTLETRDKVTAGHLKRNAYLYIRQSTLRQVLENTESTLRQYDLRRRAIALGWPSEHIVVIDQDLGRSGASAADREGFQELVTEVGMGRAGIVMGLEVSRLARNSSDWHRLLEICALTDTLILDEDGIYDPSHFNDRLLLGLKGTMSEAELHVLKARLIGGVLNKARRAELQCGLPVGFAYDAAGHVQFDPDAQVQEALRLFFRTFRRTGSAMATVKTYRTEGLRFPNRLRHGPNKSQLLWVELTHSRVLHILHNPRFAGAFYWGRTRMRQGPDGQKVWKVLPREEWFSLVPGAHPGYITWEEFEENERLLRENSVSHGHERRPGPPREGPALLQGLVVCGRCGEHMTVQYKKRQDTLIPNYVCSSRSIEHGEDLCQRISGASVDESVGRVLVESVTPMTLEVALAVQQELQSRLDQADRLRAQQVERARYEAELARRRYMQVDPDNRLVADSLEAEWNAKLRDLAAAEQESESRRASDRAALGTEQKQRILALATNFPRLWQDPSTPQRERKRMARLLLEDVTLTKTSQVTIQIRFRGGKAETLSVPLPLRVWKQRRTDPEVVAEIDHLLDDHWDAEIARILHERGHRSGVGLQLKPESVRRIRRSYGLKSQYERLRQRGFLTRRELARKLDVSQSTVKVWCSAGLLKGIRCDDRGHLYEDPGANAPARRHRKRRDNSFRQNTVGSVARGAV